jgi:hypothetical protein
VVDDEDEKIYFDMMSKNTKIDAKEFIKELDGFNGVKYRVG